MIEAFSALKTELEREQAYPDLKLIIIGDDLSGNPRFAPDRRPQRRAERRAISRLHPHRSAAIFYDYGEDFRLPVAL